MSAISFYKNLNAFTDFSDVTSEKYFADVPDDWLIVLTDIRGSTKAIANGNYKQVNLIGAACITCLMNVMKDYEFPFVFGGDGATVIVPMDCREAVGIELRKLQLTSRLEFDLDLRVGFIEVAAIRKQGYQVKVGKYQLSPGNCLAQFRGGGLTRAEEMLKGGESGVEILEPPADSQSPNLEGLSCRLDPLRSQRGSVITLLCKPYVGQSSEKVLQEILGELKSILNNDFTSASPVSLTSLKWPWLSATWRWEARLKSTSVSLRYLRALLMVLISNASLRLGFRLGPFRPEEYKKELVFNSDFKKFDETLRMVIDCDPLQVEKIRNLMSKMHEQRKICYGMHQSDEALMTCVVMSPTQNQHIHFIDGANGGYAVAAIALKEQLKNQVKN